MELDVVTLCKVMPADKFKNVPGALVATPTSPRA